MERFLKKVQKLFETKTIASWEAPPSQRIKNVAHMILQDETMNVDLLDAAYVQMQSANTEKNYGFSDKELLITLEEVAADEVTSQRFKELNHGLEPVLHQVSSPTAPETVQVLITAPLRRHAWAAELRAKENSPYANINKDIEQMIFTLAAHKGITLEH